MKRNRRQRSFRFRTWGGKRKGAGRKRRAPRPQVAHRTRPVLDGRTPVHVTLRVLPELGRLRRRDQHRVIRASLARTCERGVFRICQYSIQSNHLHLVCEAADRDALARGMIGFKTSCAHRLNRLAARKGRVFADRYHARLLASPAQVRRALCYCLNNWRRHCEAGPWRVDPFSSADAFDGWTCGRVEPPDPRAGPAPVAQPATWLLAKGWKRHPAIAPREVPGPRS